MQAAKTAEAQGVSGAQGTAVVETATGAVEGRGQKVRAMLRAQLGEEIYSSWFKSLEFEDFDGRVVKVSVPVKFVRNWIQEHYAERLLHCSRVEFATAERVEVVWRQPGVAVQRAAEARPETTIAEKAPGKDGAQPAAKGGADAKDGKDAKSGQDWKAMRRQTLRTPDTDQWDYLAAQSVVYYPTSQAAHDFFNRSADRWSKCTNHKVNIRLNDKPLPKWLSGDLERTDTKLAMPITRGTGPETRWCQHVLQLFANVIVDVEACTPKAPVTAAADIATKIQANIH